MLEALDKVFLAGLGAISMTQDKAEKIFDEYVRKGLAEKDKRSGFVKELLDRADTTRKDLEKLISEQVQKAVGSLHIATREDLRRLEDKIEQLLQKE